MTKVEVDLHSELEKSTDNGENGVVVGRVGLSDGVDVHNEARGKEVSLWCNESGCKITICELN